MTAAEAIQDLITRGNVLLGVDFDGVLAPLVDHPDDAVPDPVGLAHLRTLAASGSVRLVIVSGRSFADLIERVGPVPGATFIGEHGNDLGGLANGDAVIDTAAGFLETLKGDRAVVIERKQSSVTFHTRNLDDAATGEAVSAVRAWADEHPEFTLLDGKQVLELTVANRTKGDAIRDLAADDEGVVYIGDDTTDETVFAVLGPEDVGVKVGEGPTAARFRVKNVAEVVELLTVMALASS